MPSVIIGAGVAIAIGTGGAVWRRWRRRTRYYKALFHARTCPFHGDCHE